jgi:hypothetical protein
MVWLGQVVNGYYLADEPCRIAALAFFSLQPEAKDPLLHT